MTGASQLICIKKFQARWVHFHIFLQK